MTIRASVELDAASRGVFRAALAGVAPTLLDTMRDTVERLRLGAVERWPVAKPHKTTGRLPNKIHSRDRWVVRERLSSDAIEVMLANDAPYVYYIRSMQNQLLGKNAWQVLVMQPAKAETRRLIEESARELAALAGGGK